MRAFVLLTACLVPAAAEPFRGEHVDVELIARESSVRPGTPATVGVRFRLDEHWHVYWRNPGDSGMAPTLRWKLPEGVTASEPAWPAPHRIPMGEFVCFGYEGELLLPVTLTVPAGFAGKSLDVAVQVGWLVCEQVCLDGSAELKLSLPVAAEEPRADPAHAPLFARAEALRPKPLPRGAAAVHGGEQLLLRLDAKALRLEPGAELAYFSAEEGALDNAAKQPWEGGALRLTPSSERKTALERLRGVLVANNAHGRRAWAIDLPVGKKAKPKADSSATNGR